MSASPSRRDTREPAHTEQVRAPVRPESMLAARDPFDPERYELLEPPLHHFDVTRRSLLEALGGGLLVALVFPRALAGAAPETADGACLAQDQDDTVGAFLHIAAEGKVTVFTGKAEVGQDVRTSLAQAVADELRVPLDAIEMVMGDTARVPYDRGTFGSRSTPVMAPQLRRAAAAARQILVRTAAERWSVPADSVTLRDGAVRHEASGRRASLGELTAGEALAHRIDARVETTHAAARTATGRSVPKASGRALVTGAHRFPSDIVRPGMVHGAILRPPRFGARLQDLDAAGAEAIAGVRVVRDGDLAGVVARDTHTARRALAALRPTWDGGETASESELWQRLRRPARGRGGRGGRARGGEERGDVAAALAAAAHRVEATFTIPYIAHAPLEPRAAVAEWDDGKLTVWTGTQRPFGVRDELARAFALPPDRVRVLVPDVGSGYGGKHTGDAALEAAALARAAGKPVALRWSREEEFTWAYFRPAGVIDVAAGIDGAGKLCAWQVDNHNSGAAALEPLYAIANVRCRFHAGDSPLRQGSYRGLAATANHFARESVIDDLAALAGQDPLAFRRANLDDPRLRAVLDAAAERAGYGGELPAGTAHGLACGFDKGGYVACVATVRAKDAAFAVTRLVTAFECGAIVHPDNLENQVEGAVVQALGGALFEAVHFAGGRITNPRFSSYRVPRFGDVPELVTVLLDRPDLPSAGAGETPIVGAAPAIRNALARATGQRLRALPLALG